MTRTYFRLCVTALCALAAVVGPRIFVWEPYRLGFLLGGLAAALLTWLFLLGAIAVERSLTLRMVAILGAGSAVLSWLRVSIVAAMDRVPVALISGWKPFDPVWLVGGMAPLIIPIVAYWDLRVEHRPFGEALASALYRFSVPLALLQVSARTFALPKQYQSLFFLTGLMFLVLDGLGSGGDLPLLAGPRGDR